MFTEWRGIADMAVETVILPRAYPRSVRGHGPDQVRPRSQRISAGLASNGSAKLFVSYPCRVSWGLRPSTEVTGCHRLLP